MEIIFYIFFLTLSNIASPGVQEITVRHEAMNISDTHRFVKTGVNRWRWVFAPMKAEKSEVSVSGYGVDVEIVKSGQRMPKRFDFSGMNHLPDRTVITVKRSGKSAEIHYEGTDKSIPPVSRPFADFTVEWK